MTFEQKLTAFRTILIKEILRFSRIWIQTILPPMVTTALYFVIFGKLIGAQLGDVHGHAYMDYIVPGLILMTVISNAYANVVSSFFGTKFHRHIEELLVSPVPNYVILLGFIAGGVTRGLAVGAAVTLVASFFTDLQYHNLPVILSIMVLTAIVFSLAGFINGVYARSFDDISIIPTFVLTPLTYLGGIFYSIQMLPELWQQVSLINPILYMVDGFRYGFLGVSDISLTATYSITGGFIIALYLYSLHLLRTGKGIKQ